MTRDVGAVDGGRLMYAGVKEMVFSMRHVRQSLLVVDCLDRDAAPQAARPQYTMIVAVSRTVISRTCCDHADATIRQATSYRLAVTSI